MRRGIVVGKGQDPDLVAEGTKSGAEANDRSCDTAEIVCIEICRNKDLHVYFRIECFLCLFK